MRQKNITLVGGKDSFSLANEITKINREFGYGIPYEIHDDKCPRCGMRLNDLKRHAWYGCTYNGETRSKSDPEISYMFKDENRE